MREKNIMTESKAKDILISIKEDNNWGGSIPEIFDISIKALEKQIPKKPIIKPHKTIKDLGTVHCPCCDNDMFGDVYKPNDGWNFPQKSYCENCGQKLKWGK